MLNKQKTKSITALRYLIALPVTALVLLASNTLIASPYDDAKDVKTNISDTKNLIDSLSFDTPVTISSTTAPRFLANGGSVSSWLLDNIQYPSEAASNDEEGRVVVRFDIDAKGEVKNPMIIKGVSPALNKEALRLVNSMPRWEPAKKDGKAIAFRYSLPVIFRQTSGLVSAQAKSKKTTKDAVDVKPKFLAEGGDFYIWLSNNIKYPTELDGSSDVSGRVVVSFVIEPNGTITNANIVRSIHPALDKEALRLINSMPKWEPAKKGGKAVRYRLNLPILFQFSDEVISDNLDEALSSIDFDELSKNLDKVSKELDKVSKNLDRLYGKDFDNSNKAMRLHNKAVRTHHKALRVHSKLSKSLYSLNNKSVLYIINDKVATPEDLNAIDPNNIESIQMCKGDSIILMMKD